MSDTGKSNIEDQKVMEASKADLTLKAQKELEKHKADLAAGVQQQRVGAEFAMTAIRSMILVSGGAVLAILTFLGNLWTKSDDVARNIAHAMVPAVSAFTIALCFSLLTAMLGYLSALAQAQRLAGRATAPEATRGLKWLATYALTIRWVAIASGLVSLAAIMIAAAFAICGLQGSAS